MRTIVYQPQAVCSRQFTITVDDNNIIKNVEIVGGCNGNLQGISRLVEGQKVEEVIKRLDGIKCRGSRTGMTSCPDQLAQALKTL